LLILIFTKKHNNMTIIGIERLINWYYDTNAVYWKAFDNDRAGDSRRMVGSNFDVKDSNRDDAIRRLRSFLELYSPNGARFYIWAVDKTGNTKGGAYTWFELPAMDANTQISGIGTVQPAVDISAQIQEALDKYKAEERIRHLETELAETKKLVNDSSTERVMTTLEPYVPHIISGVFPKIKLPANVGSTEGKTTISNPEESMRNSLEILADSTDDLPLMLEKLAKLAKEDPEKFEMAKSML